MAAQPHAEPFGDGRHLFQEGDEVGAQARRVDGVIFADMAQDVLRRHALGRTGQTGGHVGREFHLARLAHRRKAFAGRVSDLAPKALGSAGALKDMDVEGGEVDQVEAHAGAAMVDAVGEVRARPVENRHEIVADRFQAAFGQVGEALFVVGDVAAPVALLLLDVFRNGQAFDHLPGQAGWTAVLHPADLVLTLADILRGPDCAGRDVVEGADDTFDAGLAHVVDGSEIAGSEPPPGLSHRLSSLPSKMAPIAPHCQIINTRVD